MWTYLTRCRLPSNQQCMQRLFSLAQSLLHDVSSIDQLLYSGQQVQVRLGDLLALGGVYTIGGYWLLWRLCRGNRTVLRRLVAGCWLL